jgi:hypothetical protein
MRVLKRRVNSDFFHDLETLRHPRKDQASISEDDEQDPSFV